MPISPTTRRSRHDDGYLKGHPPRIVDHATEREVALTHIAALQQMSSVVRAT